MVSDLEVHVELRYALQEVPRIRLLDELLHESFLLEVLRFQRFLQLLSIAAPSIFVASSLAAAIRLRYFLSVKLRDVSAG